MGEGKGDRYLTHLRGDGRNSKKQERITEILNQGQEPLIKFVAKNISKKEARELERKLIAELGTERVIVGIQRGPLLNMNGGGGGVEKHSEETKEKMRVSHTGKHHSEETKEKMRLTKQLRGPTEAQRAAWSKPKGIMTDERRRKLSESQKGKPKSRKLP